MRSSLTALALALTFVTVTALPANSLTLDDKAIINGNSIDAQLGLSAPAGLPGVAVFPSRNQPAPKSSPVAVFPSRN